MDILKLLKQAQFHGAHRLAESVHRIFWSIVMVAMLYCSISIVNEIVVRYIKSPTYLVQLESKQTLSKYPSVLLCPEIEFSNEKINRFMDSINYPPNFNKSLLKTVIRKLAAYYSPDIYYEFSELQIIENILDYNDLSVEEAGLQLTETCEESILRCRWKGEIVNCTSIFQMAMTAYGLCCIFNGRSLKSEIQEFGINNIAPSSDKWYSYSSSILANLMFVVNQTQIHMDVNLSYKWVGVLPGQHFADRFVNGTPLSPGMEHFLMYGGIRTQVSGDARYWTKNLRGCELSSQKLAMFPSYNQKYCQLECEIQRTLDQCGCVRVAHPLPPGAHYCRAGSLSCAQRVSVSFGENDCDCPPTCNEELSVTVTHSYPLIQNLSTYDTFYDNLDFNKVSIVRAYIRTHNNQLISRWPYYTSIDLFGQLGGTFNVFFGCSVLTILELIQLLFYVIRQMYHKINEV